MRITTKKISLEKIIDELAWVYGYLSINDVLQYIQCSFNKTFPNLTQTQVLNSFKKLTAEYNKTNMPALLVDEKFYFHWTTQLVWLQNGKYVQKHRIDKDQWIKSAIDDMETQKIRVFEKNNYIPSEFSDDNRKWYNDLFAELQEYILISNQKERSNYIRDNLSLNLLFYAGQQMELNDLLNMTFLLGKFDEEKIHDIKKINKLSKLLTNLFNNLRLWKYRGYSPIEYAKIHQNDKNLDKENSGFTSTVKRFGGENEKDRHESDVLHMLMWASWTHGIIPLNDFFSNCEKLGVHTNINEIQQIINKKGNRETMTIHEDCLCALLKFTDEFIPNVGYMSKHEKFLQWFISLKAKQMACHPNNELDNLSNFLNGHVYPEIVSAKWNEIAEIIGVDCANRQFSDILDFYKHSDINKSDFKKFIFRFKQKEILHVDEELKLNTLIDEVCYYVPTWANKGLSQYKIDKLKRN